MKLGVLLISLLGCCTALADGDATLNWLMTETSRASEFPIDQPTTFEWRVDNLFAPDPTQLDILRAMSTVITSAAAQPATIGFMLPEVPTRSDCAFVEELLQLDKDQRTLAALFLDDYVGTIRSIHAQHSKELLETAQAAAAVQRTPGQELEFARLIQTGCSLRSTLLDELTEPTTALIANLTTLLNDEQAQLIQLVREFLQRMNAGRVYSRLPGAAIDFIELALHLPIPDDHSRSNLITVLADSQVVRMYSAELTPLELRRGRQRFDQIAEVGRLRSLFLHDQNDAELDQRNPEVQRRQQERRADWKRIRESMFREDETVRLLNERYLGLIFDALPPDIRGFFRLVYRTRAFPMVHPDPLALDAVAAHFRRAESEEPPQVLALLEEQLSLYRILHDSLDERLERRFLKWRRYVVKRGSYVTEDRDDYNEDMISLYSQRQSLNLRTLDQLKVILDDAGIGIPSEMTSISETHKGMLSREFVWRPA